MSKKTLVKIALGQFESIQGNTAANLNKMIEMINRAAAENADLIVFPELAYTGYFCKSLEMQKLAEPQDGPFVQTLCRVAKEKRFILLQDMLNLVRFPAEFTILLSLLMTMVL